MTDLSATRTRVQPVSEMNVSQTASDMESSGYCCIPSYVNGQDLLQMQESAFSVIEHSGQTSISLKRSEQFSGTKFEELANSTDERQTRRLPGVSEYEEDSLGIPYQSRR